MIFEPVNLAIVVLTFLLAGTVKGVIGLGLPTISLAILTLAFDLASAMALMLIPSFATNLWQGAVGGHHRVVVRRLWPFMLPATLMVGVGAIALSRFQHDWLSLLLGVLIVAYALVSLAGWRPTITEAQNRWIGPLTGVLNGLLTGMTGSFVVPGVLYLNSLGLERDAIVQAMGMLFTFATIGLALSLGGAGFLTMDMGLVSLIGLPPAIGGMIVGQRLRAMLSPDRFRRVFFSALLIMGGYIVLTRLLYATW